MIDWRSILTVPPSPQYAQNPQNPSSALHFEDIGDFEYREVASDEPVHAPDGTVSKTEVTAQNPPAPKLNDEVAVRLLAKGPDKVGPVLCPGDVVEWLSPALPKQQGEVLGLYPDGTFEVLHPLSERLCRLPVVWVIRVVTTFRGGR